MPKKYIKTGKRMAYTPNDLRVALERIKNGEKMVNVSRNTGIPVRTLRRYKNKNLEVPDVPRYATTGQVFNQDEEREIKEYLVTCSTTFYGLTADQARRLVAQFAAAREKRIPKSWRDSCMAGKDWLRSFLHRHHLSLRSPEATSLARADGFNKNAVEHFYENLRGVLQKHGFEPRRIVNLDETAISNVQDCPKVVAVKGKKQVGQVTAGERGELVTVVGIIVANGNTVPPVMLYPRIRIPATHMAKGSPFGTLALNSKTGWMQADLYAEQVLPHLVTHMKASKDDPILLLVDNHATHITLESVNFCRENGIVVLTFPPHCSHRLQPLDVGIYGPLKAVFKKGLNDFIVSNPGRRPSLYDLAPIFNKAFDKAFSREHILKAFEKTGIAPFNSQVFTEEDFASSTVMVPLVVGDPETVSQEVTPVDKLSNKDLASTSITDIRPLPRLVVQKRKKGRNKGRSKVVTSTPEKRVIEQSMERKKASRKRILEEADSEDNETWREMAQDVADEIENDRPIPDDDEENKNQDNDVTDSEGWKGVKPLPPGTGIARGCFMLVKFVCNDGTVRFWIGKATDDSQSSSAGTLGRVTMSFLRRFRQRKDTFHFPDVEDHQVVFYEQIVGTVDLVKERRGLLQFLVDADEWREE